MKPQQIFARVAQCGATLGSACLTLLLACPALADIDDYLTERWYTTEVLIFERVGGEPMEEALIRQQSRHYPLNMQLMRDVGYPQTLDPLTIATLEFPTIDLLGLPDADESDAAPVVEPSVEVGPTESAPVDPLAEFLEAVSGFEADLLERSYRLLPESDLQLRRSIRGVNRSGAQVLFHGAWLQGVPEREAPQPLLFQHGIELDGVRQLEGTLSVTVARYLHFHARLWYHAPLMGAPPWELALGGTAAMGTASGSPGTPAIPSAHELYMVVDESRRIRSGTVHYLDHPRIGMLVRIDPVPVPESLLAQLKALASHQATQKKVGKHPPARCRHRADRVRIDDLPAPSCGHVHHQAEARIRQAQLPRQTCFGHARHANQRAAIGLHAVDLRG
jgi:hypothetical protein